MRRLRRNHIYGCAVTSMMERNLDQVRVTDYGQRIGVTWQLPDTENMTISEYLEYKAAKKRRLWDDVRSRRSPTKYNEANVDSFHRNKRHDIVQDSIWEQDDDSEEYQEEDDKIVQPLILEPIHTTPPNDDYVAPATKLILDELLEEFGDEILNVATIDEEADPTKDLEELERLLAMRPQSNFTEIQVDRDITSPEDKMANENVPAPAPTRSDDQILPFATWVPIGKINHVLDLQKRQKNPIFQIALDENWFTLDANLLMKALEITPIDQAHPFVSPPSGDAIMDFVNELGYPEARLLGMIGPDIRIHNFHQRSASPFHLAEEDLRLGNLKFISKGEIDEVFGMPIPNELISSNIRNASYYNAYLEMVVKHDQKVAAKKEGKKKSTSTKQPMPKPAIEKSSKPAPALKPKVTKVKPSKASTAKPPKPKPAKEKSTKATPLQKANKGKVAKVHAHVGGVAIQEPVTEAIRPLPVVEGKDTETRAKSDKTNSGGDTEILQIAGSDPSESLESRPQPEQVHMDEDQAGPDPGITCVALAGLDPKPTHDEFMADLYPKVQESLKFPADEHVILEDPLSSTGTFLLMTNLEDADAIGDQFINDKSTDDEPGKLNVEAEVVSMVTVPIYQVSSSVPPMSTPVINLSPPKPASSTTQTPIFIATTMTTTTPLPPPPQQQRKTKSELAERIAALEKKLSDLEQTNKNLDNITRNLGSRVYTLEFRDLPHKIDEVVRENVKEAVQISLQAPLRDRFRDLSKEDMKEMLHQRMFENGSYKSLPEHIALYEALEASMERAQRDKFLAEKDRSRKRRHDDQDPPPPPLLDLDLSKRRRHDTGASGSSQPQSPHSSAWKKSDTRDAPSSSSKQQSSPHAEQPVKDIPIPDSANISDSEDTDSAHLPKIKQRPEWLNPIPDDERPATPKPAWVIPTSHITDVENNLANALASTYQAPVKNSLLEKTRDMRTFMN
ncbi:hypothetical protein Tco_0335482, partial [Tanacetum coccineum]